MAELARIQESARVAARHGREEVHVGGFLATFTPSSAHPYLNYAIPDDGADPSAADVAALEEVFAQRDLVPRVEVLAVTAPAAEAALLAAGWRQEARLVVMTCTAAAEVPAPPGVQLGTPLDHSEHELLARVQAEAFGDPGPVPDAASQTRVLIERGGHALLARVDGEPAGGGIVEAPSGGVAELAGLGVLASFRRRGVGAAVTAELARRALGSGAEVVWLTPGDAGAERIYVRAGFGVAGEMVHLRR